LPNFSVFDSDTILFRPVDASPEFLRFVDGPGTIFNETGADLNFRIESDTNTHAFFLRGSDGNVGIGTASPTAKLEVVGNSTVYGTVSVAAGTTESRSIEIGAGRTGDGASFVDLIGDATYNDYGARFIRSPGVNGNTVIQTRGTGSLALLAQEAGPITMATSNEERIRITATGGVGIGTDSPSGRLHVSGDSVPAIFQSSASDGFIVFRSTTATANQVRLGVSVADMVFNTATVERMRITAAGRAIIPAGVTLGTAAGVYNAANTLDDYEEGTWTPAFTPQTGAYGSIGYAYNTGTYTKVGRLVTVTGRIQVSGTPTIGTATGNLSFLGCLLLWQPGKTFMGQ
jgi:hypothetical protein